MTTMRVDPDGLDRLGRDAGRIGEDLQTAAARWRGAIAHDEAYHLQEVTRAVEAVRDAWARDFAVCQEVLDQWGRAARQAARNYTEQDAAAAL
jgi:hypothetical protein